MAKKPGRGRVRTMAFQPTDNFYRVQNSQIVEGPYPRSKTGFGDNSTDNTLALYGHYREWEQDAGVKPGPHYTLQRGDVLVDEVTDPPRCTRTDTWVDSSADQKRERIAAQIESQRVQAECLQVDLEADPGLVARMQEANVGARQKRNELGATADEDLDAFDPVFNPRGADSIELSASLARQERAILASANPFTEQQRSDLALRATEHEAIVDAGDPQATVPEVPSFARRMVGVLGENKGWIRARRVFENPWYYLEIELRTERELDTEEYWFSIYDETAPDDRDDSSSGTTGYLTAARMTKVADGVYQLGRTAINLPRAKDFVFKFVLCEDHISKPQFDKLTLAANVMYDEYRARWSGLA